MPFMAKATVAREEGEEWVLPDEDEYEAEVDRIEEFPTVKFGTTEPTIHARIVYRITEEGEFEGATADAIYNPSLNEKAKLYPVFKAITGITPDPGKSYDLEDHLVGKPCRIIIEHRVSDRGGRFAGVSTVLPVRKKKATATAAAAAPSGSLKRRLQGEDDDDLDLEDA
jgi:hypothetical protein